MQVGEQVGPFVIDKQLGSGAMGEVYRARYTKTGQRVAIKFMAPGLGSNETALARFEREAEVLKQLNHKNIVRFYVAGKHRGCSFYAMEYVEGESLDALFQRRGRITWEEVVEYGRQICAALQHVHEQGIVHRDLKPSNVIITRDGTLKLADFGIAKDLDVTQLTSANCTVGTAAYMSPEQCRGERMLTHKSDLYSLGVMLYELLTGRKPFQAETTMDMFLAHVQGSFERPSRIVLDTPVWLDTLICQLLEKKPEHRPFDAAVVSQALGQVAEKVVAQKSAGVEAAQARIGDRLGKPKSADDTGDKSAARTLLGTQRRVKRKRRRKPFWEKTWFQVSTLLLLLAGLGFVIYLVFFKPPAEEGLFADVKRGLASEEHADRVRTRRDGIARFLKYYGDRDDEMARQVKQWADDIDASEAERSVNNKMADADDPADTQARDLAREAMKLESERKFNDAQASWQKLQQLAQAPTLNGWRVLANRRMRDIEESGRRLADLRRRLNESRNTGQDLRTENEAERLAADALRAREFVDDPTLASTRWQEVIQLAAREKAQRPWALVAAEHLHELEATVPKDPEQQLQVRLHKIDVVLNKAAEDAQQLPGRARAAYGDILALYDSDPDPNVKQRVAQAKQALQRLQTGS